MKFGNKTYDRLKFVVLIALPAAATFYLGLSQLWGFPEPEKVGASIGLLAALLGTLLQISNSQYKNDDENKDGVLEATGRDEDTGLPNLQLTITSHPEDLLQKGEAVLKVKKPPA